MTILTETRPSDPVAAFEAGRRALARQRRRATLVGLALFLAAVLVGGYVGQFFPSKLAAGLPWIGEYFQRTLPTLHWADLLSDSKTQGSVAYWYYRAGSYAVLLFETAQMAIMGTVLGAVAALLLSFPASRNLVRSHWIYHLSRRFLEICRSVPDIVYALCFVWAYGVGPLAGILAMAVHTTGALGKLFSEVNEAVDDKPLEGIRAAGGTWVQIMRFGVLPQVLPNFLSYVLLRLEINIRSASVLGFVGAGGVGQELYYIVSFNYYEELSALVLMIVAAVTLIDLGSERLRSVFISREAH
ncbi:phosphonate transport system permease protein [Inquilinus ginsengisoli]|uniref:Phosphonate transport system permease protein n=1 Tax=Inquilinus ginsengisoli TaxID=363840 RepID=A0ABU1JH70_9PROT|nr:phosphonate ABC transporter, permease protein PhnE [Inquilinus ginsengisoli]MDR6287965.1 phosphonate transport system permease protein [Inquilinus ginsengisoli]